MGKKEKYDAEYISYIESGESAAGFFGRGLPWANNMTWGGSQRLYLWQEISLGQLIRLGSGLIL